MAKSRQSRQNKQQLIMLRVDLEQPAVEAKHPTVFSKRIQNFQSIEKKKMLIMLTKVKSLFITV
jgi:hypothetical protein